MPNSIPKSKTSSDTASQNSAEKALFALRPNYGVMGRNINIFANHFSMKYTPELSVCHYDIDMEPMRIDDDLARMTFEDTDEKGVKKKFKKLNTKINRIVVEEAIKRYSETGDIFDGVLPVYDGQKNLYSKNRLKLDKYAHNGTIGSANGSLNGSVVGGDDRSVARIQVAVNYEGREINYALNIKFASIIDMSSLKRYFEGRTVVIPSDAIQVLNIILRHAPTMVKLPIANSLYLSYSEAGNTRKDIGGGRQLAYGYFQSVRLESNGVSLVIDRTATALYDSGILVKFVANVLNMKREQFQSLTELKDSDRRRVEKELTGIMVQVRHLTYKRKYKVIGLTKEPANKVEFEHKKTDPRGKEYSCGVISLVEFFKTSYPTVTIKYGHLPAIKVGSIKNPNYLPMDVCELVPDQHVRKNLTNEQMVEMIRSSASQTPAQRLEFIKQSAKSTIIESKTYLKEFGITFVSNNTPLKIEARILTPPPLVYGHNNTMQPFDGKWDVRNQSFFLPAALKHWVIIAFSNTAESRLGQLESMVKQTGGKLGMEIQPAAKHVIIRNYGPDTINNIFKKAKEVTNGNLQMIFFVINTRFQYLYESIKKVGDVDYGIVTQCIKEQNLNNLKPPLMQNILLKINTKLGGINAILKDIEVLKKRTMIVGVDSSHPGVGDRISRSVSACVASIDDSYVRYFATTRLQRRVQEIQKELQEMMGDLLTEYSDRNNGMLPEQIIVYRDGVSEGQFNAALQSEIKALSKTFAEKREGYEPKVTYIVVQKRHHTRFFPQNLAEGVGRAKNVPPGLVVDTDVVSKIHFDYFLNSHEGIQGTSRPTHYFVLWDDNELSADHLQQLTFSLTHIYARCTRSISSPAPIAYAHLAAYRAQKHIIGLKQSEDSESDSFGGSSTTGGMSAPRRHHGEEGLSDKMQIDPKFKTKMYYC